MRLIHINICIMSLNLLDPSFMGSSSEWEEVSDAFRGLLPYIFDLYMEGRLKNSS